MRSERTISQLNIHSISLIVFAILNLLDAVTTQAGLAAGISEGNPGPALFLRSGGMPLFLAIKVGLIVSLVLLLRRFPLMRWAACVGSAIFALAVISNLSLVL